MRATYRKQAKEQLVVNVVFQRFLIHGTSCLRHRIRPKKPSHYYPRRRKDSNIFQLPKKTHEKTWMLKKS